MYKIDFQKLKPICIICNTKTKIDKDRVCIHCYL